MLYYQNIPFIFPMGIEYVVFLHWFGVEIRLFSGLASDILNIALILTRNRGFVLFVGGLAGCPRMSKATITGANPVKLAETDVDTNFMAIISICGNGNRQIAHVMVSWGAWAPTTYETAKSTAYKLYRKGRAIYYVPLITDSLRITFTVTDLTGQNPITPIVDTSFTTDGATEL